MDVSEVAMNHSLSGAPFATLLAAEFFISRGADTVATEILRLAQDDMHKFLAWPDPGPLVRVVIFQLKQAFARGTYKTDGITDETMETVDHLCRTQPKQVFARPTFQRMLVELWSCRLLTFFKAEPFRYEDFKAEYGAIVKKSPHHQEPLALLLTKESRDRILTEFGPLRHHAAQFDRNALHQMRKRHFKELTQSLPDALDPIAASLGQSTLYELVLTRQRQFEQEDLEPGYETDTSDSSAMDYQEAHPPPSMFSPNHQLSSKRSASASRQSHAPTYAPSRNNKRTTQSPHAPLIPTHSGQKRKSRREAPSPINVRRYHESSSDDEYSSDSSVQLETIRRAHGQKRQSSREAESYRRDGTAAPPPQQIPSHVQRERNRVQRESRAVQSESSEDDSIIVDFSKSTFEKRRERQRRAEQRQIDEAETYKRPSNNSMEEQQQYQQQQYQQQQQQQNHSGRNGHGASNRRPNSSEAPTYVPPATTQWDFAPDHDEPEFTAHAISMAPGPISYDQLLNQQQQQMAQNAAQTANRSSGNIARSRPAAAKATAATAAAPVSNGTTRPSVTNPSNVHSASALLAPYGWDNQMDVDDNAGRADAAQPSRTAAVPRAGKRPGGQLAHVSDDEPVRTGPSAPKRTKGPYGRVVQAPSYQASLSRLDAVDDYSADDVEEEEDAMPSTVYGSNARDLVITERAPNGKVTTRAMASPNRRIPFPEKDSAFLLDSYLKYGPVWVEILAEGQHRGLFKGRTNVALKDRLRNLTKGKAKPGNNPVPDDWKRPPHGTPRMDEFLAGPQALSVPTVTAAEAASATAKRAASEAENSQTAKRTAKKVGHPAKRGGGKKSTAAKKTSKQAKASDTDTDEEESSATEEESSESSDPSFDADEQESQRAGGKASSSK
jgi:hypothetical protein